MRILDIDLDFFLNKKHVSFFSSAARPDVKEYIPWSADEVKNFLIEQCGLTEGKKLPGKIFNTHDELYFHLKDLKQSDPSLTFSLDHIDAHADMGVGDGSYAYISTEILKMPLEMRIAPRQKKLDGLSEGNFLMFAIACRWISELNYVGRYDWNDDIPPFSFKNFDISSGLIQLKQFDDWQIKAMLGGDFIESAKKQIPLANEPEIPFKFIDYAQFTSNGDYDQIVLTISPQYTPITSEKLIPIIEAFIDL